MSDYYLIRFSKEECLIYYWGWTLMLFNKNEEMCSRIIKASINTEVILKLMWRIYCRQCVLFWYHIEYQLYSTLPNYIIYFSLLFWKQPYCSTLIILSLNCSFLKKWTHSGLIPWTLVLIKIVFFLFFLNWTFVLKMKVL